MQRESKATQFNAILEVLIRFLLLGCIGVIGYQVFNAWFTLDEIHITNYFFLVGAVLLFPLNLWLDWRRFYGSVVQHDIPLSVQYHAFTQGIVVSFFTPSLIATTLGRFGLKDKIHNIKWVGSGIRTGLAQFVVSMIFAFCGSVSLFGMHRIGVTFSFAIAGFLALMVYLVKFKIPPCMMRWSIIQHRHHLDSSPNKGLILRLSVARYLVFSTQFHFILLGFGIPFHVQQVFVLMLSYGLITLSPSILFGKIAVRELIAVAVFSAFSYPKEEILFTAFFTWLINVVVPVFLSLIRLTSTWKPRYF
ncbi:MAG: hypothetical protein ACKO4Y_03670 [Flavobacteriales bacterium]